MPTRGSPNGPGHTPPQPGRDRPEWVVAINRNTWSQWPGASTIRQRSGCLRRYDEARSVKNSSAMGSRRRVCSSPVAFKCIEQCCTGLPQTGRQTQMAFVTSPRSFAGWGSLDTALLGVFGERSRCFAGRCPVGCLRRALLQRRSRSLLALLCSRNPRRPRVCRPWTRTWVLRSPTDGRPLTLPDTLPRALPGRDLRASRRWRRIQQPWLRWR